MLDKYRNELLKRLHELNRRNDHYEENYDLMVRELAAKMQELTQKAGIWENGRNKAYYQQFWEEALGYMMLEADIPVRRQSGDGKPDYSFEADGITFHIEAKAPTEGGKPDIKNIVNKYRKLASQGKDPEELRKAKAAEIEKSRIEKEKYKVRGIPLINAADIENPGADRFEDGIITADNSILRFTQVINDCINHQINGSFQSSRAIAPGDKIILAINGTNAVKNYELFEADFRHGSMTYGFHLICALFGLDGTSYYLPAEKRTVYNQSSIIGGKEVNNRWFCKGNDTPIDGIIYSCINPDNCLEYSRPPLFIPNPERENLSNYFPFCSELNCPVRNV